MGFHVCLLHKSKPRSILSGVTETCLKLLNRSNLDLAVLRAVTSFLVNTLLPLEADDAELVALYHIFNDFCGYFHTFDSWCADLNVLVVKYQQCIKREIFCAFREEVHQEGLF